MSEVLGDGYDAGESDDRDLDSDLDETFESDFDETLDDADHRSSVNDILDTVGSPAALAITALAVSTLSLVGLLSSYTLASALTVSHTNGGPLFGERANSWVQLGLGILGAILALIAHLAAVKADDIESAPQRGPRAMAGAALLISAVSIAQSVAALIIMAGAHVAGSQGG